mgnify:CR=1 FL=1
MGPVMDLTETGRVVAVEEDGVWVETIRQSTCGSCAARKGCGHGLMNRAADGTRGYIRVLPGAITPAQCQVDDRVRFAIPGSVILRGSLVVYALPLLLMLAGAAIATGAAGLLPSLSPDLLALAGCAVGLVAGTCAVRWHARAHRSDCRLQPRLLAHLGTGALRH